ncbi:uncharacterized protein [Medicago truncatula]|nr:uncharacterized protein LOC112421714 isoform X2 [Medicago truncatula]
METEGGINSEQSMSNIRARRNWNAIEEETLLTILEEMVVAGNKGENGTFKTVTHEEVCKRMKNKIPGILINAKQIVNKMKRWSTKLNEVVDMMNTGGFGWDDTKKCVKCDSSQVLSQYLEKHPKVGNHVGKEFKEFERLQGIFGKDRANGLRVDDGNGNETIENQVSDNDELVHQHDGSPISAGPSSKRPRLAQLATNFLESFNSKMEVVSTDFAKAIGKFPDPSKPDPSKSDLVQEIKKLGLTDEEEIDLAIKFSHNQQYEKFFWEFEGSQRMSFVRKIMRM